MAKIKTKPVTLQEMAQKGGKARMASLTKAERAAFARTGQKAMWASLTKAEKAARVAKMNQGRLRARGLAR